MLADFARQMCEEPSRILYRWHSREFLVGGIDTMLKSPFYPTRSLRIRRESHRAIRVSSVKDYVSWVNAKVRFRLL
jgi:hypothetical protein